MATYSYPTDFELRDIESSKLAVLNEGDPLERFMPTTDSNDWLLRWTVEGYAGGLQQLRGLDVAPPNVARVGMTDYIQEPGAYGEQMSIREKEMTTRAARFFPGMPGGRVDLTDLVAGLQDQLLDRRLALTRYVRAQLLLTGTFAIADKAGAGGVRHTDSYAVQTYDATTWATVATATPLLDFRAVQLKGRGLKADFGRRATALMNQTTFNNLIGNTNAADLGGQKTTTLSPLTAPAQFNAIMIAADLPQIEIWEDGYYDTSGTFNLFVPNGKVTVLSAPRPEGPIGEYRMAWNAVTRAGGPYAFVNDSSNIPNKTTVPPLIEVHDGHNGGGVILRPWQVVVMDVS